MNGGPIRRSYRAVLGNRSFSIKTYSEETAAAEKIEAIISLGVINSRYQDLYDLFELLIVEQLAEERIVQAAANTFLNRRTSLPNDPESLSEVHWTSTNVATEWGHFLRRIDATAPKLDSLRKDLLPRLRKNCNRVRDQIVDHDDD